MAAAGADVVVNGRSADRVAEAAERIGGRGIAADVGTAAGTAELIRQLPDADIPVNSTGIFATEPDFDITDEDRLRFYEVNVLSGVRLVRHHAPRTVARGWGRVVFVSSEAGVRTPPDMVRYGTTGTAQPAVSRGMAQEVAGSGVTVNCVLPGPGGLRQQRGRGPDSARHGPVRHDRDRAAGRLPGHGPGGRRQRRHG
ncbi:SDR family NAD(P)-dependent oxidoreductase, partial [Kitasatospora griseola]|uniref:SDR family NAD(P)-dependent oxidoreductase n=1 Tax=Kitasatospora griseola TaxID=2064 RepID=UPI00365D0E2D